MSLIKIAITAVAIATILGCGAQAAAAMGHPVGPAIVAAAAPLIQSDPTLAKTKEAIDAAAVRQAQVAAIDKTDIAAAVKDDRPPARFHAHLVWRPGRRDERPARQRRR